MTNGLLYLQLGDNQLPRATVKEGYDLRFRRKCTGDNRPGRKSLPELRIEIPDLSTPSRNSIYQC
jgi:hypothetical protein